MPKARAEPSSGASSLPSAAPPPTQPAPARSAPMPRAPAPRASASATPTLAVDASADFRAALAALNAGNSREAATAFASFLAKHPRDPRAEDAAYLRIIALQRSGDSSAMKDAALAYLRRYPKGFRRAEVEVLSRQP